MDKTRIKKELQAFGISPDLLGYHYLTECIYIVKELYSKGNVDVNLTNLYKRVADAYGSTYSRVERAVRHAITTAFERGPRELLEKFGYLSNMESGKVTNSCFICTIADQLAENQIERS